MTPKTTFKIGNPYSFFLALLLFLVSSLFLFIFAYIDTDNFDAHQLMLNAKTLVTGVGGYSLFRAILPSMLFAPAFLIERYFNQPYLGFRLCHLFNFALFILILISFYRLALIKLDVFWSRFLVFIVTLNPILIHYVPIVKEDLPALLFVNLAFYSYLLPRTTRSVVYTGILSGAAMASRYNLIPLLLGCFFIDQGIQVLKREQKLVTSLKTLFILSCVSLSVFFLVPCLLYSKAGYSSFIAAPFEFLKHLQLQYRVNVWVYQSPLQSFRFFFLAFPLILFFAFLSNAPKINTLFQKPFERFCVIWIVLFVAWHAFFIPGKEVRYFLPLFFPVLYFSVLGLRSIFAFLSNSKILIVLFSVLLFFSISLPAYKEFSYYSDPFYRNNPGKWITQILNQHRQSEKSRAKIVAKTVWVGPFYTTHPKHYVFDKFDDFFYLYHFYLHHLQFYGDETILTLNGGRIFVSPSWPVESVILPGSANILNDGDLVIANVESTVSMTRTLRPPVPPLFITKVYRKLVSNTDPIPTLTKGRSFELYSQDKITGTLKSFGVFKSSLKDTLLTYFSKSYTPIVVFYFEPLAQFSSELVPSCTACPIFGDYVETLGPFSS